ncbi:putative iron reductase [Rhizoctonia solani]|uniref:ferric-chelate reductase (NADPH) n=1 Tax=Rhizoctonia solani TaxID=456999 RepID=A0A0K6FMG4_9AGAM|nr:putative iron reductase [Rhizoctonia solani]
MEGSNNLTYLLPATGGGPSLADLDRMFALGYEVFIIIGIVILALFALPRIIRDLGSQGKHEGWRLHQSKRLANSTSNLPVIHITRSKAEVIDGEIGTKILSPKVHKVVLPGLYPMETDDGSSGLSRESEFLEKVEKNVFTEQIVTQSLSPQRQGVTAAYMSWLGAKMTKFIGGPVGMHLGPWLVVLVINIVANVFVSLAPPFFVAPDRTAHIAIAQIPILFVLGTKNNILSHILGKSYEKLNFVHRTVGKSSLFLGEEVNLRGAHDFLALQAASCLYAPHYMRLGNVVIKYSGHGDLGQTMKVPWVQAGIASWIGLIIVTFASIGIVRAKFYEFFFNSHMIGIFMFMVAIHFHAPAVVVPYTLSGLAFYVIDLVFRAWRMQIRPATISAIDDQMTLITVHDIDDGWKAGQHVWIRILKDNFSWESHPFTIANAPASHALAMANSKGRASRGLLLYARVAGDFTRTLNLNARQSSDIQTKVIVDGPYGGLGAGTVGPADYRNVILIAGGGGVSFTVAVLEDLISRSLKQKGCTEVIDFIWIVKEYEHLEWHMPKIKQIIIAADSSAISLRVCLYVTKLETAPNGKLDRPLPSLPSQSVLDHKGPDTIEIMFKRPDVVALVGEAISYAALTGQSSSGGGGVMISACGPSPMIKDVQLATRRISIKDRRLAGGVSLHTE